MREFLFLTDLPVAGGFLLALGLAALAWWLYWREVYDFPRPYAWLLPSLRAMAIALVVLMLLEPTLRYRFFEGTPTRLQVWVDATGSMQETDAGLDAATERPARYRRAIELLTASDSPLLEQWADRGEVVLQNFGGEQTTMLWQSTLSQPAPLPTDVSKWESPQWQQPTSLSLVLSQEQMKWSRSESKSESTNGTSSNDAKQTPILLLTDGQHNSGPSPLELLGQWPNETAPIYIVGFGATSPPEKVTLLKFDTPKNVFRTDRVQGSIQLQDGLTAGTRYALQIFSGDELLWTEEFVSAGPEVRSQPFGFSIAQEVEALEAAQSAGQSTSRLSLPLDARVVLAGSNREHHSSESSASRQAELDAGSRLQTVIGVTARKQRVLFLDSRSRWETRYLRNMLERDPQWELDAYLVQANRQPQWFSNLAAERTFPEKIDDFERYDLYVCGELEPNALSTEQLEHIRHAIERGAGLIVCDGGYDYWQDASMTTLRSLLPVEYSTGALPDATQIAERSATLTSDSLWQAAPTAVGDRLGILTLDKDQSVTSTESWRRLKPLRAFVPTSPLPGSQVLATLQEQDQSWPLFVTRTYGAGRVFYSASDETWRWRYEVADLVHQRLWNQVCRWTMREPFAVENEYLALDSGDVRYDQGLDIAVRARVLNADRQLASLPAIDALVYAADSANSVVATVTLPAKPDSPGVYLGRLSGLPPGDYQVQLAIPGYAADILDLHSSFRIESPPNPERLHVTRNDALLSQMAESTGGLYVPEDRAAELWQELKLRYNSRVTESDHQLWQSFWWFVPILLLISLEWWLRKKVGLI